MKNKYTYGPVPSRRLGYSLGVDIIPFKNCTYHCIYCQLGNTTNITLERKIYTPISDIINEIKVVIGRYKKIDHITFSGSGEPTLHLGIGNLINKIKEFTDIPVAVLTNSSLMNLQAVRVDIMPADIVLPTLCAVRQNTVDKIHRPHHDTSIKSIIQGLIDFRKNYTGEIWLEIMLVKGINDDAQTLKGLRLAIERIRPDRIHLNTVVRPPSENFTLPLSIKELEPVKEFFGENCQIIAQFKKEKVPEALTSIRSKIIGIIQRRPVTLRDIKKITGLNNREIVKHIDRLIRNKKIKEIQHDNQNYYEILTREVK